MLGDVVQHFLKTPGTVCVVPQLGVHRFSEAFTMRRTVCFACWVAELLFCYEHENMATLPLQHAERRPELSLAGHFASAFVHK